MTEDRQDSSSPDEAADDETVHPTGDAADEAAWNAFIDQIRSRGPNWQRYEMRGEIARGGMGVIHRIYDNDVRRPLAMKVILGKGDAEKTGDTPGVDSRSLGRFLEEAQVTGQLDHPGIVPVHELGVDHDGQVYFTMKLVKGEDLRSVFDRVHDPNDDEWNQTRALGVLLKVCEAMAYAHSKGVIHRDLKPGNVMVGKYGETYVMDWGLARVLGKKDEKDLRIRPEFGLTSTDVKSHRRDSSDASPDSPLITMDGDVVGTPAYMSPEQARGELDRMGPQSDVYAVGAMVYHLLTGHMPYVKPGLLANQHAIWRWVQSGPPDSLTHAAKGAPTELVAICEKAMTRLTEGRYADMDALAVDLRAYLEHRVVAAYESGSIAELKKWVARNKALATTAAAAALVTAALTGWFVVSVSAKERDALASEALARENEKTAFAERDRADARKAEFDQLAGVVLVEAALRKECDLYPAWPEKIAAMEQWLAEDAARLLDLMPTFRQTLADLEGRSLPRSSDDDPVRFSVNSEQFLHDTLSDLSARIAVFELGPVAEVEQRLSWARRIDELTRNHPNARFTWEDAREAIAAADGVLASELYRERPIDLKPQLGLVPIGMNPVTKLWEFYHLRSAWDPTSSLDPATIEVPQHKDDGAIEMKDGTGIVFVLIPGGTFWMGAQAGDSEGHNFDSEARADESPPHEVALDAYFLARHELTQGQWKRLTGETPSFYNEQNWGSSWGASGIEWNARHPVEQVSWEDCDLHLRETGLTLPTEAQWENGCRAGTETALRSVKEQGDRGLISHSLLRDLGLGGSFEHWKDLMDDGHVSHEAVGRLQANAFGLHDTIGNVWEWCWDEHTDYRNPARPVDGLRGDSAAVETIRVFRGGSFGYLESLARSAHRYRYAQGSRIFYLGCRAARVLSK